jgi:hypothetical protein
MEVTEDTGLAKVKFLFVVSCRLSSITPLQKVGQTEKSRYNFVIFQNTIFIDFSAVTVYNKKR